MNVLQGPWVLPPSVPAADQAPLEVDTDINIILDRSGSMSKVRKAVIENFNALIEEQKRVPGDASFSLATFNTEYSSVSSGVNLQAVQPLNELTYFPGGGTALLDAVARGIREAEERLKVRGSKKVLFVIITDGEENSSRYVTKAQIKQRVKQKEDDDGWTFVFLGANIDSFAEAGGMGIRRLNTRNYENTEKGWRDSINLVSASMTNYRTSRVAPSSFFIEEEKVH